MANSLPSRDERDRPWEANLCFTIRGANADDVARKIQKLNDCARKAGVEHGFSDYEGPQR